jgi:hypothetical protein
MSAIQYILKRNWKRYIFFSSTFSLSCLTHAYISPLIECRIGEEKTCTKLDSLKYLFTILICKEVLKMRDGEPFKLIWTYALVLLVI